jgi:hypothetical protein
MLVRMYLPRKKGNSWKTQKFHKMLLMARDLYCFGFSGKYNASPGELSLQLFAKKMSATAQKRGYTQFISQTANCFYEFTLMAKVRHQMNYHGKLDGIHVKVLNAVMKDVISGLTQKAQFIIDFNEQGVLVCKWILNQKKRVPIVGFLYLTNLAPSLVASSLYNTTRISNQSSVNLNFIQRVSTCFLFHLLAISAQLTVCLLTTGLLYLSSVLSRAGMRACLSDAGKIVRDWGDLSFSIPFPNTLLDSC